MFEMDQHIVVALDGMDLRAAEDLCRAIGMQVYAFKIHDLFDDCGKEAIKRLKASGAERVWVDLKLHDIPTTVANRAEVIRKAGADILTVHASGGVDMIRAAVSHGPDEVFAVTVLTSLGQQEEVNIFGAEPTDVVTRLVQLAKNGGAQGVVCSVHELAVLVSRPEFAGMKFVTPGVRSVGQGANDQARVATPAAAIKAGAHLIVLGRQITQSADPVQEMAKIQAEISVVLEEN